MTLEYMDLMEDLKEVKSEERIVKSDSQRRKCIKSFKSNTRVFDDNSIEVTPREKGEPSQKDVKKVGRSKRYATTGKNPLMCIELKCPDNVPDKAAFFQKELAKLTKDIEIEEPKMPEGEFLLNADNVKVKLVSTPCAKVEAWLTFEVKGLIELRKDLYSLVSEIDKCLVFNEASVCPQRQ